MSIVPKESIHVIAQSIGISNLGDDVAAALAPDVEYRMREIMQEAIKCMRHSKRSILTTEDVNSALRLRNVEPLYGFASGDPLKFRKAVGHSDLFYIDDKDVDFKEIIDAPLPKAPLDTAVIAHWLAIEGVQPAIPENVSVKPLAVPVETKKIEPTQGPRSTEQLAVDVKLPVKHVLSRELQLYFEKITELVVTGVDPVLLRHAFVSLATDSGLHPLVPYFTQFVADEVTRGLDDLPLLFSLMRVVQSLLVNPHVHVELYLHQLMPSIITCLVAKGLGGKTMGNHWELRDFTAGLVAFICERFGHAYNNLQPRITRTLINAFLDPTKAMTQHYGALKGLAALGSRVVRLLILPNIETYLKLLLPEMSLEKQRNEVKRYEAWRVYGALQQAVGNCVYEVLKSQKGLLCGSRNFRLKPGARIVGLKLEAATTETTLPMQSSSPSKKRVGEVLVGSTQQKKSFIDGGVEKHPFDDMSKSDATDMQIDGDSEHIRNAAESQVVSSKDQDKTKTDILLEAWKEELDTGVLITSLVGLFDDAMLPYIPSRELQSFL